MSLYDVCDLTKEKILNCADGMLGKYAVQLQRVQNRVKGVEISIGEKVHAKAHLFQRDAIEVYGMAARPEGVAEGTPDKISPAANDAALSAFNGWYYGEEQSANAEMSPAERADGVKKSASAMDSAYRKLRAGLKNGCDLSENTSTNKVQSWNKAFNEAEEEAEKLADFRKQCIAKGIDPDNPTPEGVDSDKEGDQTPVQLAMSQLAVKMEKISTLDAVCAKQKMASLDDWATDKLAELLKKGAGERMQG